MSNLRDELKEVFREAAAESSGRGSEHLELEELVAYHCGQRSAADEQRIQDHLVLCESCTEMLLDLAAFPDLECKESQELSTGELSARWALISKELKFPAEAPDTTRKKEGWRLWNIPVLLPAYMPYAIAATLLVAAVGLFVWVAQLRRENRRLSAQVLETERRAAQNNEQLATDRRNQNETDKSLEDARRRLEQQREESRKELEKRDVEIAELRRPPRVASGQGGAPNPAVNVSTAELYPSEVVRGGQDSAKTVEISRSARQLRLTLNSKPRGDYASYTLDILNQGGVAVWTGRGLHKNGQGNFTVTVPLRMLPEGEYRLKLYGAQAGGREALDEYLMRVQYR